MTKGHNQDANKQDKKVDPEDRKGKGEARHKTDSDKESSVGKGRNEDEDQSGGTKGKNSI
ncbi:hypothetical protein BH24BAC1_BH24BAC1_19800 [soil metagenome]|jgi:hypothetical protein